MTRVLLVALVCLASAGCSDNNNRNMQKNDTLNSQPVDQNPKVEKNMTPQTGTGGDQQGTQPSQPAAK